MIILSIDVGIKNLAYCILEIDENTHKILDWNIIDIIGENIKCCVNRKGEVCGKNIISKIKLEKKEIGYCKLKTCQKEMLSQFKKEEIIVIKDKIKEYSIIEMGEKIFDKLDTIKIDNLDIILIENQPVLKNPVMKSIQMYIVGYFINKNKSNRKKFEIKLVNASKKLKYYDGPKIVKKPNKDKYKERKEIGILHTLYFLEKFNVEWIPKFKNEIKKDDLADSYIQALSYKYN